MRWRSFSFRRAEEFFIRFYCHPDRAQRPKGLCSNSSVTSCLALRALLWEAKASVVASNAPPRCPLQEERFFCSYPGGSSRKRSALLLLSVRCFSKEERSVGKVSYSSPASPYLLYIINSGASAAWAIHWAISSINNAKG